MQPSQAKAAQASSFVPSGQAATMANAGQFQPSNQAGPVMSANLQSLVAGSPLAFADGKFKLDKFTDWFVRRRDQLAPMAVKHEI